MSPCPSLAEADVHMTFQDIRTPVAYLKPGQSLGLFGSGIGAVGRWSASVSDTRVLSQVTCVLASHGLLFRALAQGSTRLRGGWSSCIDPCPQGPPVPRFDLTVIVATEPTGSEFVVPDSDWGGGQPQVTLQVGEVAVVAVHRQFGLLPWQNLSLSNEGVLALLEPDSPAGIGLVRLRAVAPGVADLTAVAPPDCQPCGEIWGFFRVEFRVVQGPQRFDRTLGVGDSGKTLALKVGDTFAIALPPSPNGVRHFYSMSSEFHLIGYLDYPTVWNGSERMVALQAAAVGHDELVDDCGGACRKPDQIFRLSLDIAPRSDGMSLLLTDMSGWSIRHLAPGQTLELVLHAAMGPWNELRNSAPLVVGQVGVAGGDPQSRTKTLRFRGLRAGETQLSASYQCPDGERCFYAGMGTLTIDVS